MTNAGITEVIRTENVEPWTRGVEVIKKKIKNAGITKAIQKYKQRDVEEYIAEVTKKIETQAIT